MWRAAVVALLVGMAPTSRGISLRQAARNREPSEVVPNYDDTRESNSPSWLPPVPSWEEQPWEGATIGGECCRRTACVHLRLAGGRTHGWLVASLLPPAFHSHSTRAMRCFVFRTRGPGNPTRCSIYSYHSKHTLHPLSAGFARATRMAPLHSFLVDPEIPDPCSCTIIHTHITRTALRSLPSSRRFAPHRSSQVASPPRARSTALSPRLSPRPSPAGSTFRMAPPRLIPLRTVPCSRPTLAGWPR